MLLYDRYFELITKHYYKNITMCIQPLKFTIFLNLNFKMDQKVIFLYQLYLYFFFVLNFGFIPIFILLSKSFRRFNVQKGYLIGLKLNLRRKYFLFIELFYSWYYYNIFSDFKIFFADKKGSFFFIKFPLINLNYLLNYNFVTLFLYGLNIPNLKFLVNSKINNEENISLQNYFGFYN